RAAGGQPDPVRPGPEPRLRRVGPWRLLPPDPAVRAGLQPLPPAHVRDALRPARVQRRLWRGVPPPPGPPPPHELRPPPPHRAARRLLSPARASPPPPSPPPPSPSSPPPSGGYSRAPAALVGAYGKSAVASTRARLLNQEVERSRIDTRKKLFDEW